MDDTVQDPDVVIVYRLPFGIYSGIVPDVLVDLVIYDLD